MFSQALSFNQDISSWNTSKGVNFFAMFSGAKSFNQEISGWLLERALDNFIFDDEFFHLKNTTKKKKFLLDFLLFWKKN